MPEDFQNRQVYSLLEVSRSIERTISLRYSQAFWVKAELLKLNHYPKSGHCYPDLVEKVEGKVVAQLRAILWRREYQTTNNRFIKLTGEPLKDGINILFSARIQFHPVYGLSLHILDIDPQFTLGDMLREKQETILKLKEENVFDLNKKLHFPLLPKRIAVISVETSKGYSDFRKMIDNNPYKYRFDYMLFPSLLQGDAAVNELIRQLRRISLIKHHFDVVTIIRGGGGDVGLNCYDNYLLAKEVAKFPLPVITGIGHSTNETVVQMVAHKNSITPTDVAGFLIQRFQDFEMPLKASEEILRRKLPSLIEQEKKELLFLSRTIAHEANFKISKSSSLLNELTGSLKNHSVYVAKERRQQFYRAQENLNRQLSTILAAKNNEILEVEKHISLLEPHNVLKRGFSITYHEGKSIRNPKQLKKGDEITTTLYAGKLKSIVKSSENHKT